MHLNTKAVYSTLQCWVQRFKNLQENEGFCTCKRPVIIKWAWIWKSWGKLWQESRNSKVLEWWEAEYEENSDGFVAEKWEGVVNGIKCLMEILAAIHYYGFWIKKINRIYKQIPKTPKEVLTKKVEIFVKFEEGRGRVDKPKNEEERQGIFLKRFFILFLGLKVEYGLAILNLDGPITWTQWKCILRSHILILII